MKYKIIAALLLSLTLLSIQVSAALIINGDFDSCRFDGWDKDTDGRGDASSGTDFEIRNTGTSCQAVINVDHYAPSGDLNGVFLDEVFYANTLSQILDLSAATDSRLKLEISFSLESELTGQDPLFIPDYFFIGLFDGFDYFDETGNSGFLVAPTNIDGSSSQTVSFELDTSFFNQTGWALDFQVLVGVDDSNFPDAFGSSFILENVRLTEILYSTDVPEPSTLAIFALGLMGLVTCRFKKQA